MDYKKDHARYEQAKKYIKPEKGVALFVVFDHDDLGKCTRIRARSGDEDLDASYPLVQEKKDYMVFSYRKKHLILSSIFKSFYKKEDLTTNKVISYNKRLPYDEKKVIEEFKKLGELLKEMNSKAS